MLLTTLSFVTLKTNQQQQEEPLSFESIKNEYRELKFRCDFDGTNTCGGIISSSNNGVGSQFALVQSTIIGAYSPTDVTSISLL